MNLRILTYNIHKGVSWKIPLSSIQRIQTQIQHLEADIIFLQEVRGSQYKMIQPEYCPHYAYGKNVVYSKGHHGNAIYSKYPIIFSNNLDISMHRLEHRGLLHSVIQLPKNSQPLHLLCTHLGLFAKGRLKQLEMIMQYVNDNIPVNAPIILGGDFNDWKEHATNKLIKSLDFQEAFLNIYQSYAKTYPAWKPTFKLDRLYFRGFNVNYANSLSLHPWRNLSDHIALEVSLKLNVLSS